MGGAQASPGARWKSVGAAGSKGREPGWWLRALLARGVGCAAGTPRTGALARGAASAPSEPQLPVPCQRSPGFWEQMWGCCLHRTTRAGTLVLQGSSGHSWQRAVGNSSVGKNCRHCLCPEGCLLRPSRHRASLVLASSSAYKRFSELLPKEERENARFVRIPKSQILTLPELRVRCPRSQQDSLLLPGPGHVWAGPCLPTQCYALTLLLQQSPGEAVCLLHVSCANSFLVPVTLYRSLQLPAVRGGSAGKHGTVIVTLCVTDPWQSRVVCCGRTSPALICPVLAGKPLPAPDLPGVLHLTRWR